MIGIFTEPANTQLIGLVRDACNRIGLSSKNIMIIELDQEGVSAREHAFDIAKLDACIVDVDVRDSFYYALEVGSIGEGVEYTLANMSSDRSVRSHLDSKLLLITKKEISTHDTLSRLGDHYSSLSLSAGVDAKLIDALASWLRSTLEKTQPKLFISYRTPEKQFAETISKELERLGAAVWFDEWKVLPGDSIPEAINHGLAWCTHLVLVVDDTFFESRWTNAEVESVLYRHLSGRYRFRMYANSRPLIPLFLVDPTEAKMPPILARIRGIDCRKEKVQDVAARLWTAVTTIGPR